jgi:Fic family protein
VSSLFNVSARNEWDRWVEFCVDGTIIQARDTVTRCQKLLDLKEQYQSRIAERTLAIVMMTRG